MSDTYETLVREFPPRVICTEQEYKRASRIELSRRVREDLMLDPVDASDFPSPRPANDHPTSKRAPLIEEGAGVVLRGRGIEMNSEQYLSGALSMMPPKVERRLRVYRIGHPASPPIVLGPRPVERRLRVYTLSDFLLREILRGVRELEASRGAAPDNLRLVSVHFDYQAGVNLKVYIASASFEHVPEGTRPPDGGRVPPELMRPSRDPEGHAAPASSPAPHGRYLDLVREFPLRPIRTHEDYEEAQARYDEVADRVDLCRCNACRAKPAQREWWDYLEVLGDQIARYVQKALTVGTEDKPDPAKDFPILREMLDPKPDLWDDRDADADATAAGDPPDEPGPAGETPASSWRDRPPML